MSYTNIIMDKLDVSIIVPVYNSVSFLDKCVSSIMEKTRYPYEIILVDDGSTDGSSELCDGLAEKWPCIKVIHIKNAGAGEARNTGLREATGKFAIFIDSDDWIDPDMINILIDDASSNNTQAAFCGFYEQYDERSIVHSPKTEGVVGRREALKSTLNGIGKGYFTSVWNKLFQKSIIEDNSILFGSYAIAEDELWLINVLCLLDSVYLDPRPLYYWRRHDSSLLNRNRDAETWLSAITAKEKAMIYLQDDPGLKNIMAAKIYDNCIEAVFSMYIIGETEAALNLLQRIRRHRSSFFRSNLISLARKLKCALTFVAIRMRFSSRLVKRISSVKRINVNRVGLGKWRMSL